MRNWMYYGYTDTRRSGNKDTDFYRDGADICSRNIYFCRDDVDIYSNDDEIDWYIEDRRMEYYGEFFEYIRDNGDDFFGF